MQANLYALLWWIRTTVLVFFVYSGGYVLLWWVIMLDLVDKNYSGGLSCLMWFVTTFDAVVFLANCGGFCCFFLLVL